MTFHDEFVKRLRFIGGHADVLGLFADGGFLERAAAALAAPFGDAGVTKVAAVEARGFVVGSAVAVRLGVGFVPIRKVGLDPSGAEGRATDGARLARASERPADAAYGTAGARPSAASRRLGRDGESPPAL